MSGLLVYCDGAICTRVHASSEQREMLHYISVAD